MELSEMIKVMQHFDNGGEVEYSVKEDDCSSWKKCDKPIWDWFDFGYRIKEPKQKVSIEKWLGKDSKGDFIILEASNVDKYIGYKKVKLIETYEVEL